MPPRSRRFLGEKMSPCSASSKYNFRFWVIRFRQNDIIFSKKNMKRAELAPTIAPKACESKKDFLEIVEAIELRLELTASKWLIITAVAFIVCVAISSIPDQTNVT